MEFKSAIHTTGLKELAELEEIEEFGAFGMGDDLLDSPDFAGGVNSASSLGSDRCAGNAQGKLGSSPTPQNCRLPSKDSPPPIHPFCYIWT